MVVLAEEEVFVDTCRRHQVGSAIGCPGKLPLIIRDWIFLIADQRLGAERGPTGGQGVSPDGRSSLRCKTLLLGWAYKLDSRLGRALSLHR